MSENERLRQLIETPDERLELSDEEIRHLLDTWADSGGFAEGIRVVAREAYRIRRERPLEITDDMVRAALKRWFRQMGHANDFLLYDHDMHETIAAALAARPQP